MLNRLSLFKKTMAVTFVGVFVLGVSITLISFLIQGSILTSELKSETQEITDMWNKQISGVEVEHILETDIEGDSISDKYSKLMDDLVDNYPMIEHSYIFGVELTGKDDNETSLISYDQDMWKNLYQNGLTEKGMYEQPKEIVERINSLKETNSSQTTEIYENELGTWMTIMYPVNSSDGRLLGYFGVDIEASNIEEGQFELLKLSSIALIIMLALVVGAQYITLKIQLAPLKHLTHAIELARNGKYNKPLPESEDELGVVNKQFNTMLQSFREIIQAIESISGKVSDSSRNLQVSTKTNVEESVKIGQAISEVSDALDNQELSVEEASNAMEEVAVQISEVASNVGDIYKLTEGVTSNSDKGKAITERVFQSMKAISSDISESSKQIGDLVLLSKDIESITHVISDIASSTNLLALNASIEAARAGDSGKGFAVVAQEVKKLSEQTKESTTSISNLVKKVQDAVIISDKNMIKIAEDVIYGKEITKEAKELFDEIYTSNSDIVTKLQPVTLSTEEISAGVEQTASMLINLTQSSRVIVEEYQHIQSSIKEREAATKVIYDISDDLNAASERMNNIIERVRG